MATQWTLGFLSCSLHGIWSPRIQQDKLAAGKKQLVVGDLWQLDEVSILWCGLNALNRFMM